MTPLAEILWTTIGIAGAATGLIAIPGIALGHLLARRHFPGKGLLASVVALPLVLPPTAVGYLLLSLFAYQGPLGPDRLGLDLGILMSWRGAVLAAAVMSFPLVVKTARVTIEGIDPRITGMARTLGLTPGQAFLRVTLPLARPGVLAALLLGFMRAVGEFGATMIVAGNMPQTRTLALGIFSAEQMGDHRTARVLMLAAVALGMLALWLADRAAVQRPGVAR